MGDSDDSYDFGHLAPFLEQLRAGDDLVMGNRFKGGIEPGAMPLLHRYLGNPVLSFIGRLFFPSAIGDFHCGLRGFRREHRFRSLDLQTPGMEFASEMVVKATLQRAEDHRGADDALARPALAPAAPAHLARRLAAPALPPPLQPALALLLSRPGADADRPGAMIALLPGDTWRCFGTGFDVHTLVYASAMIVVGYQAILFAVFARVYAMTEGFLPAQAVAAGPDEQDSTSRSG